VCDETGSIFCPRCGLVIAEGLFGSSSGGSSTSVESEASQSGEEESEEMLTDAKFCAPDPSSTLTRALVMGDLRSVRVKVGAAHTFDDLMRLGLQPSHLKIQHKVGDAFVRSAPIEQLLEFTGATMDALADPEGLNLTVKDLLVLGATQADLDKLGFDVKKASDPPAETAASLSSTEIFRNQLRAKTVAASAAVSFAPDADHRDIVEVKPKVAATGCHEHGYESDCSSSSSSSSASSSYSSSSEEEEEPEYNWKSAQSVLIPYEQKEFAPPTAGHYPHTEKKHRSRKSKKGKSGKQIKPAHKFEYSSRQVAATLDEDAIRREVNMRLHQQMSAETAKTTESAHFASLFSGARLSSHRGLKLH
jgi:hypothetical protein